MGMILNDLAAKPNSAVGGKYSVIKVLLKLQQKFTGKDISWSLFFNNKRFQHRCFRVNFKNAFSCRTPPVAATAIEMSTETKDQKRITTKQHYPL